MVSGEVDENNLAPELSCPESYSIKKEIGLDNSWAPTNRFFFGSVIISIVKFKFDVVSYVICRSDSRVEGRTQVVLSKSSRHQHRSENEILR